MQHISKTFKVIWYKGIFWDTINCKNIYNETTTVFFNHLEIKCPAGVTNALYCFCINKIMLIYSQEVVFCIFLYLSGQRHFDRHRYQLCQEAAVEGHHEHHWVVVGENKCNLQVYHRRDMYDMLRSSFLSKSMDGKGHGVQQVSWSKSEAKRLLSLTSNEVVILYL